MQRQIKNRLVNESATGVLQALGETHVALRSCPDINFAVDGEAVPGGWTNGQPK